LEAIAAIRRHDQLDVNWDIVWRIATEHLTALKPQIEAVIAKEGF
jgi:uncharacterized protein with HEPN domain